MELVVTWKRLLRIWWAYLWRSLITILGAGVISFFIGLFTGLVLQYFGVNVNEARLPLQIMGGAIGLFMSVIPLQLVLEKDFGEFRIALLSNNDA